MADRLLASFGERVAAVVVGASGGVGGALLERLEDDPAVERIYALSRSAVRRSSSRVRPMRVDLLDEETLRRAAIAVETEGPVHLVLVATGLLHDGEALQPEKSWRDLDGASLQRLFAVNATGPALVAKHFLPLLDRSRRAAFAALSARVGSIGDNRLGGWHGYRSSKAALNMIVRGLAIELARRNPSALCVTLHPGTVDTDLSEPFQRNVDPTQLFTPARAAERILGVLDGLAPADSGGFFAWDGEPIPY